MLIIKNLTKKFNNAAILDSISLSVPRGSIALLLGESGVGKSTLLRVLNNLQQPDAGTVLLDDKELDLKTVNQNHMVGMIFQHFNLFDHFSVQENITKPLELVLKKNKHEAHTVALELLKCYGLETKCNEPVNKLSGGQKQRLAIARALAMRPTILCADEPTSALDPSLKTVVAQTMKDLAEQGLIVLIASHDIALLQLLPCTIYLMKAGKIIETADSHAFAQNKAAYPHINHFVKQAY